MLTSLTIQNVALVDRLSIEFRSGLTVITGETGAGKSIVIDALSLALGERASTAMIRDGEKKAIVEAEFDTDSIIGIRKLVESSGADWQSVLILRREVSDKGVSRCFINDSPVQVATLKSVGDALVDIHGQHEHQSLLRAETHLVILDSYASIESLKSEYAAHYNTFTTALKALKQARATVDDIEYRRTVIEKELREINLIDPKDGEDSEIDRLLNIAEHAERINLASSEILSLLYEGEENTTTMMGRSRKLLDDLAAVDSTLAPLQSEIQSALASVDEIAHTIRDYLDKIEFDPLRTEEMKKRSMELNSLKKKLHLSLPEIIERRTALADELTGLGSMDETLERLAMELEDRRLEASRAAEKLSAARLAAGNKLAKGVVKELATLGMKKCSFETRMTTHPAGDTDSNYLLAGDARVLANDNGWDALEFYLSANLGEELKPLAKVVSGGEASRIMLALKTMFANKDTVPILVFDEIEVGVSGAIASKVGAAMKALSQSHQILSITHLPQIAGLGKTHLLVEKSVSGKRTITHVRNIGGHEREKEVARLLSGDKITDTALKNAKELILDD